MRRKTMANIFSHLFRVGRRHPQPTSAANLRQCPHGHSTLKDVPIEYGLLDFSGPEGQALQEAINNYEIWPGGCTPMSAPGQTRVICTSCGFSFDDFMQAWMRQSDDPSSFVRPFSGPTNSFPRPTVEEQQGTTSYGQDIADGKVVAERLTYITKEDVQALMVRIREWLSLHDNQTQYSESSTLVAYGGESDSSKFIEKTCRWEGPGVNVRLLFCEVSGRCDVWLDVRASHAASE